MSAALGFALALFASSVDPTPPAAPEHTTAVVVDADTRALGDAFAARASERVYRALTESGRLVLAGERLARSLDAKGMGELLHCTTDACIAEIARAVFADSVVVVTLARIGPTVTITLRERDPFARTVLATETGECAFVDDEIARAVSAHASALARATAERLPTYGLLVVESVPAGLTVRADERTIGKTPLALQVKTGKVSLAVGIPKAGSVPADVVVRHREQSTVDVRLFEIAPPPTEEERAYQADVAFGSYFFVGKMLVGSAMALVFTAAALYVGSGAVALAPFALLADYDLRRFETWIFSVYFGLTLTAISLALVGVAIGVWGVVDMIDEPIPPKPSSMFHRVMVTTSVSNETFEYPIDDGRLGPPPAPPEPPADRDDGTLDDGTLDDDGE